MNNDNNNDESKKFANKIRQSTQAKIDAENQAKEREFEKFRIVNDGEISDEEKEYRRKQQLKENYVKTQAGIDTGIALIGWKDAVKGTFSKSTEHYAFDRACREFGGVEVFKVMQKNGNNPFDALATLSGHNNMSELIRADKQAKDSLTKTIADKNEKIERQNEMKEAFKQALKEHKSNG